MCAHIRTSVNTHVLFMTPPDQLNQYRCSVLSNMLSQAHVKPEEIKRLPLRGQHLLFSLYHTVVASWECCLVLIGKWNFFNRLDNFHAYRRFHQSVLCTLISSAFQRLFTLSALFSSGLLGSSNSKQNEQLKHLAKVDQAFSNINHSETDLK